MDVPDLAGALDFSFANGFTSTPQGLSLPLISSISSHHWPGRDCHHLRSLWHQLTREDLHQPSYSLFSSINSGLRSGFSGCETFVPNANPLESGTKPPVCQQLQGIPKPIIPVTPAMCLIWLGEESSQGEFLQQNLFFPSISSFRLALALPQEPDTSPCTNHICRCLFLELDMRGGNLLCNKKPGLTTV